MSFRLYYLTLLLALSFASPALADVDLSGDWRVNLGWEITITQNGDQLTGVAKHPPAIKEFRASVIGDQVEAEILAEITEVARKCFGVAEKRLGFSMTIVETPTGIMMEGLFDRGFINYQEQENGEIDCSYEKNEATIQFTRAPPALRPELLFLAKSGDSYEPVSGPVGGDELIVIEARFEERPPRPMFQVDLNWKGGETKVRLLRAPGNGSVFRSKPFKAADLGIASPE